MEDLKENAAARASQSLDEAWPTIDPLVTPIGNMVLVQMRRPKQVTAGGIVIVQETQDYDKSVVRVGKVLGMGPIAYKKRESLEPWPEGAWVAVGDFVRVPHMAGVDSWRIQTGEHEEARGSKSVKVKDWVHFAMFNDYDMKGLVKGNPLDVVDYV